MSCARERTRPSGGTPSAASRSATSSAKRAPAWNSVAQPSAELTAVAADNPSQVVADDSETEQIAKLPLQLSACSMIGAVGCVHLALLLSNEGHVIEIPA